MSAFVQKIILTVLAVGIYALSALPALKDVALLLQPVAGLLIGAAWITKPGDGQLVEAGKQAIRSRSVPPIALALPLVFLIGCAGANVDPALANRMAANDLRAQVNEASDQLERVHGALPFVCAYLGPDSARCVALEDGYRVAARLVDTAHRAVDLIDAVGVGAVETRAQVERVLDEAKQLGAAVADASNEVTNALGHHQRSIPDGGEADQAGPAPAAPEGGAPTPGSAPAP